MTIKKFCRLHGACADGAKWALSCGASTMDELWARDDVKPDEVKRAKAKDYMPKLTTGIRT